MHQADQEHEDPLWFVEPITWIWLGPAEQKVAQRRDLLLNDVTFLHDPSIPCKTEDRPVRGVSFLQVSPDAFTIGSILGLQRPETESFKSSEELQTMQDGGVVYGLIGPCNVKVALFRQIRILSNDFGIA